MFLLKPPFPVDFQMPRFDDTGGYPVSMRPGWPIQKPIWFTVLVARRGAPDTSSSVERWAIHPASPTALRCEVPSIAMGFYQSVATFEPTTWRKMNARWWGWWLNQKFFHFQIFTSHWRTSSNRKPTIGDMNSAKIKKISKTKTWLILNVYTLWQFNIAMENAHS